MQSDSLACIKHGTSQSDCLYYCLYRIYAGILINSILHNFQQHEKKYMVGLLLYLLHWVFLIRGILTRKSPLTVLRCFFFFFLTPPPLPLFYISDDWKNFPQTSSGGMHLSPFFFFFSIILIFAMLSAVGPFHFPTQPLACGIYAMMFGVGRVGSRNISGSHPYV